MTAVDAASERAAASMSPYRLRVAQNTACFIVDLFSGMKKAPRRTLGCESFAVGRVRA